MNVIFIRIALEELSFSGGNGCLPKELIDRIYFRVVDNFNYNYSLQLKHTNVKKTIIYEVIRHPNTRVTDLKDGKVCSIEYALSKAPDFDGIKLYSNECLHRYILDLNIYTNISEVEGRLAVYMAIAGKGFEGCWQYEISKMLNMDPKVVFQHLKSLYKYDIIVRFSIPMPVNHKKKLFSTEDSNQVPGGHISAVIWLTKFFDFNRIPRELSQLIWCQHVQPLSTEIVRILEYKAPGKIAWEKDIRTLCTGFLILHDENSADHLICSQKAANKAFNKVRDALLTKNVIRVFAWNPATKSYLPCLCLKDAFLTSNIELLKDQMTIKTEVDVPNINELSSSTETNQNNLALSGDFEKFSNEGVPSDIAIDDSGYYYNVKNVFELTEVDQVLWLIRASGKIGMVSLEIVRLIGINIKRLGKLLADLCKIGVIYKVPQRYNRTFMYRYYYCSNESKAENFNTSGDHKTNDVFCKDEKSHESISVISKIFSEAFPNANNDLSNLTEQFVRRLVLTKKWIEEHGILTIPEFAKLFSEEENTSKGPDRKTIRRILLKLKEIDDTIKETFITSVKNINNSQSGDVAVFFSSKRFKEEEARDLKAIQLKNKRSISTKHAIEKRKRELSHVAAIVDASIAVTPKQNDNGLKNTTNRSNDSLTYESKINCEDSSKIKLISSENGDASVVVNTNFTVASLNIEIDDSNLKSSSNSSKTIGISSLNIPGTFSTLGSHEKFVPSKRMNLGFSSLASENIKFGSNVKEIGFINFNQKILAHYGFIFPLMIRLKVLHYHIISLILNNKESNTFSTREILEEMNIDVFLRVIGFGYRSSFIEEYLMFGSSDSFLFNSNTKLKDLPQNIYETLTKTRLKKNVSEYESIGITTNNSIESKSRRATHILFKMLNLLTKLNLLSCKSVKSEDNSIKSTEANLEDSSIDAVSISNSIWEVGVNVEIPLIINSSEFSRDELIKFIKHEERVFNFNQDGELDNYWVKLYNESLKTQKLIMESNFKEYSLLLPEIILKRHWKANSLLSIEKRNYLENYARSLVFGKIECENSDTPIVLSLASPEIKKISSELSISPLTTLRYLLRVVDSISVEKNSYNEKESLRKVIFHPIRDPRYQCHICHVLYSTHPAIISHYKVIHDISTINTSMYTIQKHQSVKSKNKSLNLNSSLKIQIINEDYIPISLRHLIEDTDKDHKNTLEKNMKTELLRAFLRLSKEDISLLYFILFISEKMHSGFSNTNKIKNLKKIFSLCTDNRNNENSLYTLQFSRIKSLMLDNIGTNDIFLEFAIEFVFSCLKTIYPLNSKLIETLKLKESQRICWNDAVRSSSFSNRWKEFLISQSNTDIDIKNLLSEVGIDFYRSENILETDGFLRSSKIDLDIYKFLIINKLKSVLLTPKYIVNLDNVDNFFYGMEEDTVNSYFEYCVNNNIIKQLNKQSEFKPENKSYPSGMYTLSRNVLINCFGKSVLWREIFDLCSAGLEIQCSENNRIIIKNKINGAYALNYLNNLLDEKCTFEVEWNDEDFYEKATNKTNEDLLRLLNEVTETNSENCEIDILEELNYDINPRDNEGLDFVEDQPNVEKSRKLSKIDDDIESSLIQGTINEEKGSPIISKIIVNYKGDSNKNNNTVKELLNIKNVPKIPFIGATDSDHIEINKIPYYFSIAGILNDYSELEIKRLKRNETSDPIIGIIKKIFDILNNDTEITKIVLTVISLIIIKMKDEKQLFSIRDIENFILSLDEKSINTFRTIGNEIEDPGIAIYKLQIPFTYHLMFFLEFTRICTRVPIDDDWLYTTFSSENNSLYANEPIFEDFLPTDSGGLRIPINIPTRIWLLWSSNSLTEIFSKGEIRTIYNIINKSIDKFSSLNKEKLYLDINVKNKKPFNSFISPDGEINRPICGILIYYICHSIYKSPIISISEFTDKFSIFSSCEIKFIIESMLGEKCVFINNADIILSKPIYSVLRIFEQ